MDYPTVAILIPTFNRGELLAENLKHLEANLSYAGEIKILIGDDSDNDDLAYVMSEENALFKKHWIRVYSRHYPRKGLGANLNWLCESINCDLAIAMDDDHRLIKPLDITPFVDKLLADDTAGWIRLMGTGGHKLQAELQDTFWRVSWFSPELYIASFRAHLFKVKEWSEMYGHFPEGLKLGQTEDHYNHVCIDKARGRAMADVPTLDVLVPLSAPEDCWTETGHSWQLEGF